MFNAFITATTSAFIAICAVLSATSAESAESAARPNFVIIMADDLGYGDLSCYDGWIETPQIDKLAAEGMRFTDFHSSGNVCSPTRAGLMTGRYQQRAGIPGVVYADSSRPVHYHGLQPREVTFAEQLKEAGYATAIFGKWHLGYLKKYNPIHHGFDEFRGYVSGNVDFFSHVDQSGNYDWWHGDEQVEEDGYVTHLITTHAVDFIKEHKDEPFCLYLPHEAPHYPYQGPNDKPERSVDGKFQTTGGRSDKREAYREMVVEMDRGVGQVVAALEAAGIAQNTLVWFFSDNGATRLGSNGELRGTKGTNWEGGHRVPSIAWWPGKIEPAEVTDQLAITLDVMPTVLDLADVAQPKDRDLDGVSLAPLLLEDKPIGERQLVWNGVAMRDGSWKLVTNARGLKKGPALYNLEKDIGEEQDVSKQHSERVERMKTALDQWKRDVAEDATPQPSPAKK